MALPQPGGAAAYAPRPLLPYTRVGRNLQALGILWIVYAALHALSGLLGMLFLHGIFGGQYSNGWNYAWGPWDHTAWVPFGHVWMAALWPLALSSILVGAGVSVLVACALLTRQSWGRVLAIVFSIFALIHFPLGTALGVYTLWVLAPRASGYEYAALAATRKG